MKEDVVRIAIRRARNVAGPMNGTVCLAPARCYCRDRGNLPYLSTRYFIPTTQNVQTLPE